MPAFFVGHLVFWCVMIALPHVVLAGIEFGEIRGSTPTTVSGLEIRYQSNPRAVPCAHTCPRDRGEWSWRWQHPDP